VNEAAVTSSAGRSLRSEILLLCGACIMLVSLVSGSLAYYLLESNLLTESTTNQRHIVDHRADLIYNYLNNQINHLIDISQSHEAATALQELSSVYPQGVQTAVYGQLNTRYRQRFASFADRWQLADLLLINRAGDVIFSVNHVSDFSSNLNNGPYSNSALADVFRQSLQSLSPRQSSFSFYAPSRDAAAFMAVPVIHDHHLWGVVAIRLNTDALYTIAGNLAGLGNSGEIVLGSRTDDGVLLTAPLRTDADAAFKRIIKADSDIGTPILDATQGRSGQGQLRDWRGMDVIAAWTFIPGLNWGIVAKIDRAESMQKLFNVRNALFISLAIITLLVLLIASIYSRRLTRPLVELARATQAIGEGRLDSYPEPIRAGNRETAILSDNFQQMAARILHYQRGLEHEIESQTADLRRLQAAIEHCDNIIMITNRDAIIEYVNPAFERVSGYSADYATGRPASLIKSGKMKTAFYQAMWDTILDGRNWKAVFINRKRDGTHYEVEQVISPISNQHNQITGFVSVQRDVTHERKELRRLEHRQRLESFVEPLDLNSMVSESSELLKSSIGKHVALNIELTKPLPLIEADRGQIRQVIMNLIINASEAIEAPHGVIHIRTGMMQADSDYLASAWLDEELDSGSYVYIEVADNGCGMSDETKKHLFDPFYTTKFTGCGLGMSAILGIIRGHQGAIKVDTEPGHGSTFNVLIPALLDDSDALQFNRM